MKNLTRIKLKKAIICLILLAINNYSFAQDQNITINRTVNNDNSVNLNYEKKIPGSYYLFLELSDVRNCYAEVYRGVITGSSGRLLNIKPIDAQQTISYSYKFNTIIGVPDPKTDSLFQYFLPFKTGEKVKIQEAVNIGEKYFGAEKPQNWKSYVVNLKSADTIFSMRKGIVVKIINEYNDDASIKKNYTSKRNYIIVEHEDGTLASYKGFQINSIKVKLGQTVYPQTQLGLVQLFDKTTNNYRFDFSIYYLSNYENISNSEKRTYKDYSGYYNFITPRFLTTDGLTIVEPNKEYMASFDESILLQEMTRSEKKKYAKDPSQFK
ncbi:M23 family metallopeptidase [Flavobacterium flavipallidum]|uniref:Peptidase M23-like protein n=1 Tax=Flavobacterium flavipallidum TaxID=3139140 RepID=A0ABU9HR22_9FLAO